MESRRRILRDELSISPKYDEALNCAMSRKSFETRIETEKRENAPGGSKGTERAHTEQSKQRPKTRGQEKPVRSGATSRSISDPRMIAGHRDRRPGKTAGQNGLRTGRKPGTTRTSSSHSQPAFPFTSPSLLRRSSVAVARSPVHCRQPTLCYRKHLKLVH